jgi:hypothetical protein
LIAAAVALGRAIQTGNGAYDAGGIIWLAIGCGLCWGGIAWGRKTLSLSGWAVLGLLAAGLIIELVQLELSDPIKDGSAPGFFYFFAVPLLAILTVGAFWRREGIYLLAAAHFVIGACLMRQSPRPDIDVYHVTQASCVAMTHGVDPYSIDFDRVYKDRPDWEKAFYPPGFIVGDRTKFGYPYMPLSCMADFLGHVIGGDFRLAHLLAIDIAAVLMVSLRRTFSVGAAAVLLLTPRVFYVVEYGWAEPIVVACLAWVVWCACRKSKALPYATGLLLVSKQHMILAAPMVFFLLPRPWQWRTSITFLARAAITGAVVTLPLVLWNWRAFFHSAIELQIKNPFRGDSLNFAAMWFRNGGPQMPNWIGFAAALAMTVIVFWRMPRTPAGFAAGVAAVYLAFFVLAKQAFCNYYFLIIGALCCAAAAWGDCLEPE